MTSIYLFYLSKIICLNTFSEFLSFIYITSKAKYFTQSRWASQKVSIVLDVTSSYIIIFHN